MARMYVHTHVTVCMNMCVPMHLYSEVSSEARCEDIGLPSLCRPICAMVTEGQCLPGYQCVSLFQRLQGRACRFVVWRGVVSAPRMAPWLLCAPGEGSRRWRGRTSRGMMYAKSHGAWACPVRLLVPLGAGASGTSGRENTARV